MTCSKRPPTGANQSKSKSYENADFVPYHRFAVGLLPVQTSDDLDRDAGQPACRDQASHNMDSRHGTGATAGRANRADRPPRFEPPRNLGSGIGRKDQPRRVAIPLARKQDGRSGNTDAAADRISGQHVYRDREVEVEKIVEVERKLTWWQQTQIRGFWVTIIIILVLLRKKIFPLIRRFI